MDENVKPNNHEQSKQHTFDGSWKKILKHETRDYYDELQQQCKRKKTFSDLSAKETEQLYTVNKHFVTEQIFNVLGPDVIVIGDVIVEALEGLPKRKRDIICFPISLNCLTEKLGTS